ncbi:MAG: hypothetical protein BWY75_02346 [bacterium ADurb.Bin425]|nr:MAG: hypothetical protein BWY75_02346 [bacterium ADurb.Bin425]
MVGKCHYYHKSRCFSIGVSLDFWNNRYRLFRFLRLVENKIFAPIEPLALPKGSQAVVAIAHELYFELGLTGGTPSR